MKRFPTVCFYIHSKVLATKNLALAQKWDEPLPIKCFIIWRELLETLSTCLPNGSKATYPSIGVSRSLHEDVVSEGEKITLIENHIIQE